MKFIPKNVRRFQEGGPAPEEPTQAPAEGAPEGGAEQDPLMMLAQGAAQALLSLDCKMALQVCLGLISLIQLMSQGGAPLEEAGEPVFRKGGRLIRRIKY